MARDRSTRLARAVLSAVLLVGTMQLACYQEPSTPSEKAAVAAAHKWLKVVDDGRYGDSWTAAAVWFREQVPKRSWESQVRAVRRPMGKMIRRKVKSMQYTTSLPGTPSGHFVVIQFETKFKKRKAAIETVTPMKETDGTWKVSGYYIN